MYFIVWKRNIVLINWPFSVLVGEMKGNSTTINSCKSLNMEKRLIFKSLFWKSEWFLKVYSGKSINSCKILIWKSEWTLAEIFLFKLELWHADLAATLDFSDSVNHSSLFLWTVFLFTFLWRIFSQIDLVSPGWALTCSIWIWIGFNTNSIWSHQRLQPLLSNTEKVKKTYFLM